MCMLYVMDLYFIHVQIIVLICHHKSFEGSRAPPRAPTAAPPTFMNMHCMTLIWVPL